MKKILTFIALAALTLPAMATAGDATSIGSEEVTLDLTTAVISEVTGRGTVKSNTPEGGEPYQSLDNFAQNQTATFTLNNTVEQRYAIVFEAANGNNAAPTLKFTIKSGETIIHEETKGLKGDWDWNSYRTYQLATLSALPTGNLTLTLTFNSTDGWGTENVRNIKIKPYTDDLSTVNATGETTLDFNKAGIVDAANGEPRIEYSGNIGYTYNQCNVTWLLGNVPAKSFVISMDATSGNDNAQLRVELLQPNGTVVATNTFDVAKSADWSGYTNYSFTTSALAAGDYMLNVVFLNAGSNIKNVKLMPLTQLPATIDLNSGVYSPTGNWWECIHVEDNGNVGFIKNGATARYNNLYNAEASEYQLKMFMTALSGGTMTVQVCNAETDAVEFTQTVNITGTYNSTYTQTFTINSLSAGAKYLTLSFAADGDGWVCNYNNVRFVKATDTPLALDEDNMPTLEAGTRNVTLTRAIAANQWATIVLPFALTNDQVKEAFGSDVKLKQMSDETSSTEVKLSDATALNANEPYLIRVATAFTSATIEGVTIVPPTDPKKTVNGVTFQGTYTTKDIPAGAYFLANNQLYKAVENTTANTIKPMRGYFTVADGGNARLRIAFDDSETTAVQSVATESQQTEQVFDLQGRRVIAPAKGLYIVNGKKVVMK